MPVYDIEGAGNLGRADFMRWCKSSTALVRYRVQFRHTVFNFFMCISASRTLKTGHNIWHYAGPLTKRIRVQETPNRWRTSLVVLRVNDAVSC